jgi:hypothetical protein
LLQCVSLLLAQSGHTEASVHPRCVCATYARDIRNVGVGLVASLAERGADQQIPIAV